MFAPLAFAAIAVAKPMPELPPNTTTWLPCSDVEDGMVIDFLTKMITEMTLSHSTSSLITLTWHIAHAYGE
jgi:hypothetical protein